MNYDKKFILYSFVIIFSILFAFISYINYSTYTLQKHFLKTKIKKEIELCSYKLDCKHIQIDFVKKTKKLPLLELEKDNNKLYMLFDLPNFKKYYLKLSISTANYLKNLDKIKHNIYKSFLIELFFIFLFTAAITYILYKPLKQAYKINETFIKDILHDLNTPLTSLKLNIFMLKKESQNNERINKIEHNIKMILNYQENLKNFLSNNPHQIDTVNLKEFIDEKLKFYSLSYPYIKYTNHVKNCPLRINKNAFSSILDNIISNAFKYNKKNGEINVYLKNKKLIIEDTGIGIKNPDKVFKRFYKENKRGTGIGMNIVKKLSDELKIPVNVISEYQKGTTIVLDLNNYC